MSKGLLYLLSVSTVMPLQKAVAGPQPTQNCTDQKLMQEQAFGFNLACLSTTVGAVSKL